MNRNPTIAAMFIQGTKFFDVFMRTYNSLAKSSISSDIAYTPAFLVNLSFSCEMYLKCLLYIYNNDFNRVHNLLQLFLQLNKNIRDEIKTSYKSEIIKLGYRHLLDFDYQLIQHQNVFIDWRYYYDSDSKHSIPGADYNFLKVLSLVLLKVTDDNIHINTDIY